MYFYRVGITDECELRVYVTVIPEGPQGTRKERERAALVEIFTKGLMSDVAYEVAHTPEGAPYLPQRPDCSISISHSRNLLALAIAPAGISIGVDIESQRGQLARVAPRVLSPGELRQYDDGGDGLLKAWTLKEALYKAAQTQGLDFARDIKIPCDGEKYAMVRGEAYEILISEAVALESLPQSCNSACIPRHWVSAVVNFCQTKSNILPIK